MTLQFCSGRTDAGDTKLMNFTARLLASSLQKNQTLHHANTASSLTTRDQVKGSANIKLCITSTTTGTGSHCSACNGASSRALCKKQPEVLKLVQWETFVQLKDLLQVLKHNCQLGGGQRGAWVGLYRLGLALLDGVCLKGLEGSGQALKAPPLQAASQPVLQVPLVVQRLLPPMERLCQALRTHTHNTAYSALSCLLRLASSVLSIVISRIQNLWLFGNAHWQVGQAMRKTQCTYGQQDCTEVAVCSLDNTELPGDIKPTTVHQSLCRKVC